MLLQTDYSLFSSALTVKKAVSIAEDYAVLCDTNLFAVPTFVYECRAQNKKPIIGLQKKLGDAKYLFIALNNDGYHKLVEYESLGFKEEILNDKDVLSILIEIIGKNIKKTKYSLVSNDKLNNKLLENYSEIQLKSRIVNGYEDDDIYTIGVIKAIGDQRGFDETIINVDFENNLTKDNLLTSLLADVEDYFKFGNPTPPKFKFREEVSSKYGIQTSDDQELFEFLCMKGLNFRFKELNIQESERQIYLDRLSFEMNVIKNMKFPGYMLIVWDFVNYAKSVNIPVGPGRGSAAGSLVAFALRITNIDPIKYGLLFERFLNPDRISFPDIDMDFAQNGRADIINYVSEKYGKECVSQVITFGKIGGKSSIRDAARVYRDPLYLADKIAKSIPEKPGMTLEKARKEDKEFWDKWAKEDFAVSRILNGAERISGMTRNLGVHAAGLIIGTVPIYKKAPLYMIGDAQVVGFDGKYLEDVDLVKFDFLGLKTLDVIDSTIREIQKNHNIKIDFNKINIEDKGTYDFIKKGNNLGVFQIESAGMRGLAKSLQPDKFEEIIAMLALFRPGPMEAGMLESFIERKHGRQKVDYFFDSMEEALKPILEPTYGLIVYQEQVMQIVQAIGGFSLGEADLVRRAMGKKKAEEMEKISKDFASGAEKKGYKKEEAIELFHLIEKFAGYGFNKSHSAAYAMITFQTAYLKAYYPLEFFTALLNLNINDVDKISLYIKEAKDLGINIVKPNIYTSESLFTNNGKEIFFGLKAIKGVGSGANTIKIALNVLGKKTDLFKLLSLTQIDIKKDLESYNSKISRFEKQIQNIQKNKNSSLSMIEKRKNAIKKKKESGKNYDIDTNSIQSHESKILEYDQKISLLNDDISKLKEKINDISKIPLHETMEKINKRVFESLSLVGALDSFGFSRKTLLENSKYFLELSFDKIVSSDEYDSFELMSKEEELCGVAFTSPFSEDVLSYETVKEAPIAVILNKEEKRKKSGDKYLQIKVITTNYEVIELSDFNLKSSKFSVGDLVELSLRFNGNYTNLASIQKFNKKHFSIKEVEVKKRELDITILDPIPSLEGVDSINVFDLNGNLIAILS